MKANFHLITETDDEVLACTAFIEDILRKRKLRHPMPAFTPSASVPIAGPDDDDEIHAGKPVVIKGLREAPNGGLIVPRLNVSPGDPAISKIGETAKMMILSDLANSKPQPLPKFAEHLKLLWKRGEIKFDGKEYYL